MDEENKIYRRFLYFVLASLLLHIGLGFFFYRVHIPREELQAPTQQEVVFVRPEDILPPSALNRQGGEIVDLAKPRVEKAPDKARFLSQYDSTVKKETVARKLPKKASPKIDVSDESGARPKRAEFKPKKKSPKVASRPPIEEAKTPKDKEPGFTEEGASKLTYSDLELKPSDFKDLIKPSEKSKVDKEEQALEDSRRFAAIQPRPGPSGPGDKFVHDFMPNVKIGDKTYLNAMAHPDVQYFTRLKRVFRLRFNPRTPLVRYFRSNRVVVGKVNVTMAMEVTPSGHLTKLFVVRSSGIPGYDREALRTVRQSAPFSATPKRIQGKDGMLRMTWNFTTYI